MDLRERLIDFLKWHKPEYHESSINSFVDNWIALRESINCASDETQADRQNEQTKEVCDHVWATVESDRKTFYMCSKCGMCDD